MTDYELSEPMEPRLERFLAAAGAPPTFDADGLKARLDANRSTGRRARRSPSTRRVIGWTLVALLSAAALILLARTTVRASGVAVRDPDAVALGEADATVSTLWARLGAVRGPRYGKVQAFDASRVPTGRIAYDRWVLLDGEHRDSAGSLQMQLDRPEQLEASALPTRWADGTPLQRWRLRKAVDERVSAPGGYRIMPAERSELWLLPSTLDLWRAEYADRSPRAPLFGLLFEGDTAWLGRSIADFRRHGSARRDSTLIYTMPRISRREAVRVLDLDALLALMPGLPVDRTWSAVVQIEHESARLDLNGVMPRLLPMRTAGDSTLRTRWGVEPCWRVLVGTGDEPETWWVSRRTGEVVLVQIPPGEQLMSELEATALPGHDGRP